KFLVSGRVQGVGFRYFTGHEAQRLGLTGYAKNLADGRVEVLACGTPEQVEALYHWLHQGSPHAEVEKVEAQVCDDEVKRGFAMY
ncbi:MAG: acylphosphatase, partial [Vibrio sp.]